MWKYFGKLGWQARTITIEKKNSQFLGWGLFVIESVCSCFSWADWPSFLKCENDCWAFLVKSVCTGLLQDPSAEWLFSSLMWKYFGKVGWQASSFLILPINLEKIAQNFLSVCPSFSWADWPCFLKCENISKKDSKVPVRNRSDYPPRKIGNIFKKYENILKKYENILKKYENILKKDGKKWRHLLVRNRLDYPPVGDGGPPTLWQ